MLWLCSYSVRPDARHHAVADLILERHDAQGNRPENILAIYRFADGKRGLLIVDAETPRDIEQVVGPYRTALDWTAEPVYETTYSQIVNELQIAAKSQAVEELATGLTPIQLSRGKVQR